MNQDFRDYRVNFQSHLRLLNGFLWYFGFYVVAMMCIWLIKLDGYEILLWSSTGLMLIFLLPALYLHYCYYEQSRERLIRIYEEQIEVFEKEKLMIIITRENIISVDLFMCPNTIDYDTTSGLTIEDYNYVKLRTVDNEIIIDNLICPKVKALAAIFNNIKPVYHTTLFAQP
jgi:hypothetical protein